MSIEHFRPPATPLITHTPYFSIWCAADKLTDAWSTHWTGHIQAMCGMIRIDGSSLRFMGVKPAELPVLKQKNVSVRATTTTYEFEGHGIALEVEFLSPLLPKHLDLLTRPVTYITFTLYATDKSEHCVQIYFDNTAEFVVNKSDQKVIAVRYHLNEMELLSFQSTEQLVLAKKGDDVRIDWGIQYLAIPGSVQKQTSISATELSRNTFAHHGVLPDSDDMNFPRAANDNWPGISTVFFFDKITQHVVSRHILLA